MPDGISITEFSAPDTGRALANADSAGLLAAANDVTLLVDGEGIIVDAAASVDLPPLKQWVGRPLIDTVTVESRPKIDEMLAGTGPASVWRQVNHGTEDADIPLKYRAIPMVDGRRLVIGRDLRPSAILQQRLLQAQQSLERDYLKLRNTERRYRLLFDQAADPIFIIEAVGRKIREANPAAHALLGKRPGTLAGKAFPTLFGKAQRDELISFIGSALHAAHAPIMPIEAGKPLRDFVASASAFRQDGESFVLMRLADSLSPDEQEANRLVLDLIDRMPDAFVVADANLDILAVNDAFSDAVGAASGDLLLGKPLASMLGRPGIDLDLVAEQLVRSGTVRNVGTVLRQLQGSGEEEVELSAVRVDGDHPSFGFALRPVGRRLRDLPPAEEGLPRSVEQLTSLVGRMSLKDIVRESTDLIERLCIEAALDYTEDNRASAAEILGVSRQSLYSKLNRYGMGRDNG